MDDTTTKQLTADDLFHMWQEERRKLARVNNELRTALLEVDQQRVVNAELLAACQAAIDFYAWHMSAVPSQVLEELVDRRAALQAQLRAAIDRAVQS